MDSGKELGSTERMDSQVIKRSWIGKENQRMKITQTILKTPAANQETTAMEIKYKLKEKVIVVMEHKQKAAWIVKKGGGSEQRWRWTRQGGWKKVKGIGNVVLNTWKLHWISESK